MDQAHERTTDQVGNTAQRTGRMSVRRLTVVAALLTITAGWLSYHLVGGPTPASGTYVAVPVEPLPQWDRQQLDVQTRTVLADWPTMLNDAPTVRNRLAIRANLFEAARTRQIAGDHDETALTAATFIRVQSIIAVGNDLRCTIDGKLYRTGDTFTVEGVSFELVAVGTTDIEIATDDATFKVPVRL
ncbi:MAG: hypothetical protein AAGD32_05445 [Planctomycetota bacterium]